MKSLVRACGAAAAALALVASVSHANTADLGAPAPTLADLVEAKAGADTPDAEQECLARAVYFEARSEPLEGQLAVADVILNRVASPRYPDTICDVVVQRAQFSFIRHGRFPEVDRTTDAWRKAVAVAEIARQDIADQLSDNVLWYHANYVAPVWRHRLTREAQIGAHIFYS